MRERHRKRVRKERGRRLAVRWWGTLALSVGAVAAAVALAPSLGRAEENAIFRLVTFSTGNHVRLGPT